MKLRVLVVEDDPDILSLITELLDEEGYQATGVYDLQAAHDELAKGPFNLVLADFLLDGHEQVSSWRSLTVMQAQAAPTPVGIVTAYRLSPEEVEQRGFAFCLRKPFSTEDFLSAVGSYASCPPFSGAQEAVIRAYFDALGSNDWQRLGSLCTADVTYHLPGDDPRFCRTIRGRSEFQGFVRETYADFPEASFDVGPIIRLPGGAVTRYRGRWRGPKGKFEELDGAVLFHFRGEAISEIGVRLNLKALSAVSGDGGLDR